MRFRARFVYDDGEGIRHLEIDRATALKIETIGVKNNQFLLLTFDEERSAISHAHYFAVLGNAWANLPEDLAADFPTAEHLRKWALIKAGYIAGTHTTVCRSGAEARRWAMFSKQVDKYAIAVVQDRIVTVHQAASQSLEAMGKVKFQKSKDAVFNVVSQLLGVDVTELKRTEPEDDDVKQHGSDQEPPE